MKKLFKKLYNYLTNVKSYHTYEPIPYYMEKYYQPIPKEELNKPLPGDEEIHTFCAFGICLCGALAFLLLIPW